MEGGGPPGGFPGGFHGMPGMPGGMGGMNMDMLQAMMNDPNIRRMTEAIAQDPVFQEMAKGMQESMLAGGMGGLNLGANGVGEEDAGEGGAAPRGMPGMPGMMPGMPGMGGMMPGVDPSKYMEAMQRVMQNSEFMAAAESLGRGLMQQGMSAEDQAMLEVFQNPANQAALKERMAALKDDPELGEFMTDLEENGQEALMKYFNDPEMMTKLGRKFQEAMADPEFRSQLEGAEGIDGAAAEQLENGAGEEEEEEEEETIITVASAGSLDRLKELLAAEGADADMRDEEGRTALHFSAGYGELECMKALLAAGASPDAKDGNDNTALHYAAGYGNIDAAKVLIEGGADVSVANHEGKTAAEVAALNEQAELVAVLNAAVKE